jgi:hypothetical protein
MGMRLDAAGLHRSTTKALRVWITPCCRRLIQYHAALTSALPKNRALGLRLDRKGTVRVPTEIYTRGCH